MESNGLETLKRDDAIRALRNDGWTLKQIAEAHGISQSRVRQILQKKPIPLVPNAPLSRLSTRAINSLLAAGIGLDVPSMTAAIKSRAIRMGGGVHGVGLKTYNEILTACGMKPVKSTSIVSTLAALPAEDRDKITKAIELLGSYGIRVHVDPRRINRQS